MELRRLGRREGQAATGQRRNGGAVEVERTSSGQRQQRVRGNAAALGRAADGRVVGTAIGAGSQLPGFTIPKAAGSGSKSRLGILRWLANGDF